MDAIKNLPLPLRIGIPAVIAVVVIAALWLTVFAKPAPVEIVKTQDTGIYAAAQTVLETKGIPFTRESDSTTSRYVLMVHPDDKTIASDELAKSGIKDLSGTAAAIECPAPPGFTATKAANDRSNNCEDAKSVQQMLLTAGASAANVKVSQMANDTLLGPETTKSVLAQVFLTPAMQDKWPADQAARAIATAVGTSIDRVTLTDDKLQTLFDGTRSGGTPGAAVGGGVGSGAGCNDMATATEIATKAAAVRSCYKDTIGADLTTLLGGSDRFVLTVDAKIDPVSKTTQNNRYRSGAVSERMKQRGGGQSIDDTSMSPNSISTSSIKPAGDISKLALTVSLDSNFVDERQELAVKQLLSTYVDKSRKDPAPKVTRIAFAGGGAGEAAGESQLEALRVAATDPDAPSAAIRTVTKSEMPKPLVALMAVIVIGLISAIAILWRRSSASAAERARYEQEFQHQQRLLDNFAQQDPNAIARDLEALFGAPTAPERTPV